LWGSDWEAAPPRLAWTADGLGSGFAAVSVAGGRIYATGDLDGGQGVVALAEADGRVLWRTPITGEAPKHGYPGSRCTPTVDGDRLYVVTSDGTLACLRAADGEVVWKRGFEADWGGRMMSGWGFAESPLVDGDRVICTPGGSEALLVAVDKRTGEEIWRSPDRQGKESGKDGAGYASIVVSEGGGVRQYVQITGRGLVGVRASDGAPLWSYNRIANTVANIPTPLVQGDSVFGSTGYDAGAALLRLHRDGDGVRAEEVYFLDGDTLQNHHGGMVLVDGYVYTGHRHNEGYPTCVELASGKIAWGGNDNRGPGRGSAGVLYADGHLVFRYQNGLVALVEATPEAYRLRGTFTPAYVEDPSWSHPVIANGKLYLREQDRLMCYALGGAGEGEK
jgi:outer membrane protein assembly factor BamB